MKPLKANTITPLADGIHWTSRTHAHASEDLPKHALVVPTGTRGITFSVSKFRGEPHLPIFVTRYRIPAGRKGDVMPWVFIKKTDTGDALKGDPVYASLEEPGTWTTFEGGPRIGAVVAPGAVILCPNQNPAGK